MYRIYVVEDDEVISKAVSEGFEKWGYTVKCAQNFENIVSEFTEFDPHLIILDIMLPFYNGHHWCSEIRKVSKVPILFLSSASDNMNIVMAINMGGDDFVSKPFEMSVLLAKAGALLRRTYDFGAPSHLLEYGDAFLNVSDFTLRKGESVLSLTKNECQILKMLLENKGSVVSRSNLMIRLWESDDYIDENTLTVNVARLRKKIREAGFDDLIQTKKGEGYIVG